MCPCAQTYEGGEGVRYQTLLEFAPTCLFPGHFLNLLPCGRFTVNQCYVRFSTDAKPYNFLAWGSALFLYIPMPLCSVCACKCAGASVKPPARHQYHMCTSSLASKQPDLDFAWRVWGIYMQIHCFSRLHFVCISKCEGYCLAIKTNTDITHCTLKNGGVGL